MEQKKVVVLGAGMTGLATAQRLCRSGEFDVTVIDKAPTVGGMCQSFNDGDFILDYGPHKFYSLINGIVDELKDVMNGELLERDKSQKLFMHGKYFSFPLKMSEMLTKFPPFTSFKILWSYGIQLLKRPFQKEAETYEEFIEQRFGRGLYEQIFKPMASKVYGDPSKLDRRLAEVRISSPGLMSVVKQLLFKSSVDRTISAPTFHYPKAGFGRIPERFKEECEQKGAKFHLSSTITQLGTQDGRVSSVTFNTKDGETKTLDADFVIYSIPPNLLPKLFSETSTELEGDCAEVKFRHTVVYYFLVNSPPVLPAMWVFFPEDNFRFGRLSEMAHFSPHTVPDGQTALMVDFTCEEGDPLWKMDDKELGEYLLKQMAPLNLFKPDQIIRKFSRRFQNIYPVYSTGFQGHLKNVRKLEKDLGNLFFIGRLGDFSYNNSDQCMDMGFSVADYIKEHGQVGDAWREIRTERFDQYKIVD